MRGSVPLDPQVVLGNYSEGNIGGEGRLNGSGRGGDHADRGWINSLADGSHGPWSGVKVVHVHAGVRHGELSNISDLRRSDKSDLVNYLECAGVDSGRVDGVRSVAAIWVGAGVVFGDGNSTDSRKSIDGVLHILGGCRAVQTGRRLAPKD